MTKKIVTLHLYAKTGRWADPGDTEVYDTDFREHATCMENRVWLGQTDVELDFPEIDIVSAQIDNLTAAIQKERADSVARVNLLLDRISNLQAIGYDAPTSQSEESAF